MPFRNSHVQDSNRCLGSTTPEVNPEESSFDMCFNVDEPMEESHGWMGMPCDSLVFQRDLPIPERSHSWDMGTERGITKTVSTSHPTAARVSINELPFEFSFQYPPFGLQQMLQSTHNLQPDSENTPTPAQSEPLQSTATSHQTYYPTTTTTETQNLQNISPPFLTLSANNLSSSPAPPPTSHLSVSTSPTTPPHPKKKRRKSSLKNPEPSCQTRKREHNAIEKRYRTNLNAKINSLRQGIPSLCNEPTSADATLDSDDDDGTDSKSAQKHGKAVVLTRALEYIEHLEKTTKGLGNDVVELKTRVGAFEKLAIGGSMLFNSPGALEVKLETLESIQADFQNIRQKPKECARRRKGPKISESL